MPKTNNLKVGTNIAYSPLAYHINSILLFNHRNEEVGDIQNLVTSFSIEESINRLGLMATFAIKDVVNMMEDFELCGQERIEVSLSRQEHEDGESTEINLTFIPIEYPLYTRGSEISAQAYEIKAVSPHIYFGQLKTLSRAFNDTTEKEIHRILREDLNIENVLQRGETISRKQGIYRIKSPLDHLKWLVNQSYDAQFYPFFLYATLHNDIRLDSLQEMLSQDIYREYTRGSFYTKDPNSSDMYQQKATRILEIISNLRVGKLDKAMAGAFGAERNFIDLSTKNQLRNSFKYSDLGEERPLIDIDWDRGDGKPIENSKNSIHYEFEADMQWDDLYELPLDRISQIRKSTILGYKNSLHSYEHEIELCGDFNLNAGKRIVLNIPKAKDIAADNETEPFDLHLSGEYLVTSTVHSFDKDYRTGIRVKRNHCPLTLND